jgi:hypothetical protein
LLFRIAFSTQQSAFSPRGLLALSSFAASKVRVKDRRVRGLNAENARKIDFDVDADFLVEVRNLAGERAGTNAKLLRGLNAEGRVLKAQLCQADAERSANMLE